METTKNGIYWVNVVEAPVSVYAVTGENKRELVATFEEPGTHSFPAMSSQTEFEGGKVGVITGPFDSTRTLGGKGGAGGSTGPVVPAAPPSDGVLKGGKVYLVTATDGLDLSALTVEEYATAELWIDYTAGSVTLGAWTWPDDDEPTEWEAGKRYALVLRNDGLGLLASLNYSRALS